MAPRWTVVIVVVLAVAGVITPAFAMSAADEHADREASPFEPLPSEETNTTTGSQISAFMASSSAAVDSSVETGMWLARFNDSDANRTEMVERRANALRDRLHALETQLDERNASGNVSLSDPSEAREVASLKARIDALNSTIERTRTAAGGAGVNTTRLDRLRENASRLHGHEVARIARNLTTVGPPANRGPPEDRPGPNTGPAGPPGQNDSDSGGPPADRPGQNAGDRPGPPEDGPGQSDSSSRGSQTNDHGQNETDSRGPPEDNPGRDSSNSADPPADDSGRNDSSAITPRPIRNGRPVLLSRW
ncbi:hypothetical protein [Halapricum desulfuricans]|uniref:Putative component of type IV pili like system n=1 Tax=Halapricum desulfuricans TaxID=2841257 RepID=A0A897N3H1_9EURY|nr:hypothetical protein [Halapricum desulfuricans]QSG07184.1 putative component of type IV pili like system [Halapricum desulfuricans]